MQINIPNREFWQEEFNSVIKLEFGVWKKLVFGAWMADGRHPSGLDDKPLAV